jgi:hypothetical protein
LLEKEKEKRFEQYSAKSSPSGPTAQESACARAHAGYFTESPSVFWLTGNGFGYYFSESLTVYTGVPRFLFLHRLGSPTMANTEPGSDELDWPEGAKTGANLRFTPNSNPEEYFPSINF